MTNEEVSSSKFLHGKHLHLLLTLFAGLVVTMHASPASSIVMVVASGSGESLALTLSAASINECVKKGVQAKFLAGASEPEV